jgi:glutamate N-acetyltransferase/amino-acid N-acetyltransferase
MTEIPGGVCAANGYRAAGIHCGIRKNRDKKDLALIVSGQRAAAAAVYTQNLVQGAPIAVTKRNLADGYAAAVICNSGNANTCSAGGEEAAAEMCRYVEACAGIPAGDVIVASTGVIGQPLALEPIKTGMTELAAALDRRGLAAAQAIMTTDTFAKEAAVEFEIGGRLCRLGGIAKGSGMIHPNMATMLAFLTSDAAISPELLQNALSDDVADTFNMISVDGDTSTNDMVSIMANGMAGNPPIEAEGPDFDAFKRALNSVTARLCRMIAGDGEGATKLLECRVTGAASAADARAAARAVIRSNLLKAAIYGSDANWGRVLCAVGYSGAALGAGKIDVGFKSASGSVEVCRGGMGVAFSEETAARVLGCGEITITVNLGAGGFSATAWGCDLTPGYVAINSDYRS